MIPIDIPVPPMLEQAVDYRGGARFFGLHWEPCGDEAACDDGRLSHDGFPHGYLMFIRHPAVALALAGHDLGGSDSHAAEWLIIDRRERKAYLASVAEARRFLREQWQESRSVPLVLTQAEFEAAFEDVRSDWAAQPLPTAAEVMAALEEHRLVVAAMVAWLDATPQARRARNAIRKLTDQ